MDGKIVVKAQRVKRYFLDAAKQIIAAEGVESVSTRRVAEIAGYSYASIYNYFKDRDELLGATKASMVGDVLKYMQAAMNLSIGKLEDFKSLFVAYVKYYLAHPHVFRFFYFFKLSENEANKENYDFSVPWASALRFLVEDGIIEAGEVESCAKTLIFAVHGLLALFFSGNGLTEETLFEDLGRIIDFTLRRKEIDR